MKNRKALSMSMAWLATAALCVPQLAFAQTPGSKPEIADVALRDGGVLLGQLVNTEGVALAGARVALRSGDRELGAGTTDQNGYFAFSGLRTGVYQLATAEGQATYRAWTAQAAPPGVQPGALLVAGNGAVRGQYRPDVGKWLLVGGLVAAAIAIPVAVHNANLKPGSR